MAAKKKSSRKKGARKEPSFEQALTELEDIVQRLDGEELGIEAALAEYEKGLKALEVCRTVLAKAERKLELLVNVKDGAAQTEPFAHPSPDGEGGADDADDDDGGKNRDGYLF